jgi:hypothetical protein
MTTWIKTARYHLVQRMNYVTWPWAVVAFYFAIDWVIIAALRGHDSHPSGVVAVYAIFFILGALSVARSLPFGLALGLSRRSYYLGTVLLAVSLAVLDGLPLAGLQAIERATGGWGFDMYIFRLPYILDGPWYLTWLTSFVLLMLLFVYGLWFGLVYLRWNRRGLVAFSAAQIVVLLAGALLVTWTDAWHSVGHFFTAVGAAGLTGVLAALAVALLAGGYATIRRVTV